MSVYNITRDTRFKKTFIITIVSSILFLCAHPAQAQDKYVLLAWNDLGMHCYNHDFQDLAVLPPYNTLWAQLIKVGNPPQIITSGVTLHYAFPDNTTSVTKSNFWDYALQLFGVSLPADIGLTGKGLSGTFDLQNDHFVAEGIPLTEFSDSAPNTRAPYQLAVVTANDSVSGKELATITVVAPVSTEMRCDSCHADNGQEDIATGRVETNILTLHDKENSDEYPAGHTTPLMNRRPVLCAECHSSNALGKPGVAGLPSLSRAMHDKHAGKVPNTLAGCYSCHPGPQTQCLRDVMTQESGFDCIRCHGGMDSVASNSSPWNVEPRCDSSNCHGSNYTQNNALYRYSTGHGAIYCAGCHDSPHAIALSREPNDAIKFIAWQGHSGTLEECMTCHASAPSGNGPHGMQYSAPSPMGFLYLLLMEPSH
ncbi:hypothetical protein [Desulfovibrio inopinatus]|uniref:hypothetical protein n=1 Tax=Desulfovibrio inopinatus TaxID=102109 RepID=UPI000403D6C8|nr:hypothetical protein [Desulfovibrio inopinatus]